MRPSQGFAETVEQGHLFQESREHMFKIEGNKGGVAVGGGGCKCNFREQET